MGKNSANNFTRNIPQDVWEVYHLQLLPNGGDIAESLDVKYGDDNELHISEQVVSDHIDRYLHGLTSSKAQMLLKFVTGSETLQSPIRLIFNSEDSDHGMLPKAHTCSRELEVSRFTPSYDWLSNTLNNIISESHARTGFQFV